MRKHKSRLRILLISDTRGNSDEGMKNIARSLAGELNKTDDINVAISNPRSALKQVNSVDLIHYIAGPTYRSVLLLGLLKTVNPKLLTILTFTNPFWGAPANILVKIFCPDHVIAASQHWRDWAEQNRIPYGMLVISGVDIERFTPPSALLKTQLRKRLGLPATKTIALHVGHLKHNRNLALLQGPQQDPALQIVVVGSTTTRVCERLARNLEQAGCIVFRSYQPRIHEFYQAADCYIFPTLDNRAAIQTPLSILEAMAVGIPVITTPFGALPDIFQNVAGFIYFTPERVDSSGLADMIKSATQAKSANREAVEEYSWAKVASRLSSLYRELSG